MSKPKREPRLFERLKISLEEAIAFTRGELMLRTTEVSDEPAVLKSAQDGGTKPGTRPMILRRGITGFRHVDDEPLPVTDSPAFHGHCHEIARRVEGKLVAGGASLNGVERNFIYQMLAIPAGQVAVLLNAHYPVIAFAHPLNAGEVSLHFMDSGALAEAFRFFGVYEVLGLAELEAPLHQEAFGELSAAELEQLKYWKPRRVGDLIFNFWD
jgi:hypothetical protein